MTGKEEYPGRTSIACSENHTYYIPAPMIRDELNDSVKIDLHNVLAGLQWYQVHNNEALNQLSTTERAQLLSEIFRNSNDLLSLARTVELQTGTEGLIKSVVESYDWAEWKISPQIGDVTEVVLLKPHIGFEVKVGRKPLVAISSRKIEVNEDEQPSENNGQPVKLPADFEISSQLEIYMGDEIVEDDEHCLLQEFNLRVIEVLPGERIRFEGTEDWGDDDELEDPERMFYSYILTNKGDLEFDSREKIDRKIALRQLAKTAEGAFCILPGEEAGNWHEIKESLKEPMARKALSFFLLPYCDMPTSSGAYYVLPE